MKIYFASVGSDCLEGFLKVNKTRNVLFSFYDLTLGGFQFRKISWEKITGVGLRRRRKVRND